MTNTDTTSGAADDVSRSTGPEEAESVDRAEMAVSRGIQVNPRTPGVGFEEFPALAVDALRDGQRQLDEEGVEVGVSRQAVDEVLAWIARFVPRSLDGADLAGRLVGGMFEIRIDDPGLDQVDLVRVNGRPFVPEVPTVEVDLVADVESVVALILMRVSAFQRERSIPQASILHLTPGELVEIVRDALGGRGSVDVDVDSTLGFDEDHSVGSRRQGRDGRSISHSHGTEGRNYVD